MPAMLNPTIATIIAITKTTRDQLSKFAILYTPEEDSTLYRIQNYL